jgi:hypothetical protein
MSSKLTVPLLVAMRRLAEAMTTAGYVFEVMMKPRILAAIVNLAWAYLRLRNRFPEPLDQADQMAVDDAPGLIELGMSTMAAGEGLEQARGSSGKPQQ